MTSLLMFTDASPQEFTKHAEGGVWKTLAGIGIYLPSSPFASGLIVPRPEGSARVLSIPNPTALVAALEASSGRSFVEWKRMKGRERKSAAVVRLLEACAEGKFLFLSHSTRTDIEREVADRYLVLLKLGDKIRSAVRSGVLGYQLPGLNGPGAFISEADMPSFLWIARSLGIFAKKAAEAQRIEDALFLHDNLPLSRFGDVASIENLLNATSDISAHFIAGGDEFDFTPADNIAGAMNAFVSGNDHTVQEWVWKNGRPKNFYMTVDEPNGAFTRFI